VIALLATFWIAPGPVRDRYQDEYAAELHGLHGVARLARALSLVAGGPALHRALVESGAVAFPHAPWWCRLRLHHRWRPEVTADGAHFRRCRDCGLDNDGTTMARASGVMLRGPSQ
jgi:hypothetical protein